MMKTVLLFVVATVTASLALAQKRKGREPAPPYQPGTRESLAARGALRFARVPQEPSDAEIELAMVRGKTTPAKKLWEDIKKKQQYRINRAGFSDPIEKKVLILSDLDRIALEAAEAKRQLREISADDIKKNLPLGVMEILLEANCYNNMYAGSLPKWGPNGGVHVVLKVDGKIIQPLDKGAGENDSIAVLPQEHGVLSQQSGTVTYTPLYRTAIYERASEPAWFMFPALTNDVKMFTVTAISGEGKQKEKDVENPLK